MSIAFHSLVAAAAVAMSIQTGSFPPDAPRQMEILMPVAPPPPMPRGNPDAQRNPTPKPPAAQPQPQHAQTAPAQPQRDVTPNVIPNTVQAVGPTDTAGPTTGSGNNDKGPWGVPDGDPNAVDIGQPLVQAPTAAPAGPLVAVGDVHAARVLSRVEPKYPALALRGKMGGVVRVHCIIDKNGNISDPEIVSSSFQPFNQPVLDALRQWTFAPGTLHGTPVDTYFELTITFTPR